MVFNIVTQKENPLLHRKELSVESKESKTTISRKELREKLALQLNVDLERVSIPKISQKFGTKATTTSVRVYDSKETLEKTELPHTVFRNRGEKKKPRKKEATKK